MPLVPQGDVLERRQGMEAESRETRTSANDRVALGRHGARDFCPSANGSSATGYGARRSGSPPPPSQRRRRRWGTAPQLSVAVALDDWVERIGSRPSMRQTSSRRRGRTWANVPIATRSPDLTAPGARRAICAGSDTERRLRRTTWARRGHNGAHDAGCPCGGARGCAATLESAEGEQRSRGQLERRASAVQDVGDDAMWTRNPPRWILEVGRKAMTSWRVWLRSVETAPVQPALALIRRGRRRDDAAFRVDLHTADRPGARLVLEYWLKRRAISGRE